MSNMDKKRKILIIGIIAIIMLVVALVTVLLINSKPKREISEENELETKRYLAYNEITDSDANIDNCEYVKFSSFFIRDLDGDGYAEKYDGTCNSIEGKATLYFDINVLTDGRLEDGKITINGKNFDLSTALVKDNVIQNDYISSNTKEILLNIIQYGTQKLFSGNIVANINNNINNYSVTDNKVILTGTWISTDGNTTKDIHKEITLKTDWYGKTSTSAYQHITTTHDIDTILGTDCVTLSFDVGYTETAGELIIQKQVTEVTIPDFNGYAPDDVIVNSSNCNYEYNEDTRMLTISRGAEVNADGLVTKSISRTNTYNINVKYPLEAFTDLINKSVNITIPTVGYYYGYNNSSIDFAEQNPYVTQASRSWTHVWKEIETEGIKYLERFYVYVERNGVVSKEMPLQIYNNLEQEEGKSDEYIVEWSGYTGNSFENPNGMYMKEYKTDEFLNSSGQYTSMENYIHTKGIYFSGIDGMLASYGWLKVYDDESTSNEPLLTITKEDFNKYTSSNPYYFDKTVNKIRIETVGANELSTLNVYQIKEIDDERLTSDYSLEEFENLNYIYSYMTGGLFGDTHEMKNTLTDQDYARYEAPYSLANFSITPDVMNNQETKRVTMRIATGGFNYNEAKWKNSFFVLEMPEEILEVTINDVKSSNSNVEVTSYEVYEENGKQYIRIYTRNDIETTFSLTIDADIAADPRSPTITKEVRLYAINEYCNNYKVESRSEDVLDINNNGNTAENVLYATKLLQIVAPSSLNTLQILSDFDDKGTEIVSPQTAVLDKSNKARDANINIAVTNNYSETISEMVIVGKIPFEGNSYQINGRELGSTYSVTMKNTGITVPDSLKGVAKVYYSTNPDTNNNISDSSNNWKTADQVTDWSQIKTYAIDLSEHVLKKGEVLTFTYGIIIPETVNYNNVAYSTHGVYFCLDTEDGKLRTQTEVNRLGIMIAKKFDVLLTKYKKGTNTGVQGATYKISDGKNARTGITNENGIAIVSGLYAGIEYTLQEIASPDNCVLNENIIKIEVIQDDDGNPQVLTEGEMKGTATLNNVKGTYVVNIAVEDIEKYDIKLIKKDSQSGELLKGVKFRLTGGEYGEFGRIFKTNADGSTAMIGLIPDTEYTIEETEAIGYYVNSEKMTFTVKRGVDGNLEIISENNEIKNATVSDPDGIYKVGLNVELVNEKIPVYSLNINKNDKNNNLLAGTQFKLSSIDTGEEFYGTTNESGVVTFDGLYQYVEGKYITGEYILQEMVATEGYITDTTEIRFKAEKNTDGILIITILEGEDVITSFNSNSTSITFNIENKPIFRLTKTGDNGIPLANAKFKITDLDGNTVKDANGNFIGELDNNGYYVVTTNENGEATANLPEGLYMVEEVEAPEGYELPEEEDRIQYVGIGRSRPEELEMGNKWTQQIKGNGFSKILDMKATSEGGYIVVGSFAEECDINADGKPDFTALGGTDAYIAKFNADGEYEWHYVLGTAGADEFKRIDLVPDGGYVAIGYEYSSTYKDAVIVKVNNSGTEVWKVKPVTVPEGKEAYGDELTSVKVLPDGKIVITGNYYGDEVKVGTTLHTNENQRQQGFVAWLDANGNYIRSIALIGTDVSESVKANVNVRDVTVTNRGVVVSVDYIGKLNVNGTELNTTTNQQDSVIIRYSLDGTICQGNTPITGTNTESIERLITDNEDNIIALGGFGSTLKLGSDSITIKMANVSNAIMIKYDSNGSYISNYVVRVTYSTNENDNKFTSAVQTSDGGLLIGGWFYSPNIDVDGDGTSDITNKGQGDGIVIKLQEDGKVEWSKQIGGNMIDATYAVAELDNGTYVAAGSFNSTSLTVDTMDNALTIQGEMDAYMTAFGKIVTAAEVPQRQTIDVVNELKKFKVTTEIDENSDGERAGGTITGTQTSEDYINLVEEVKYGYDSTVPIVITPSANYSVYKVTVNGEEIQFTPDANGVVTLPVFEDVTHNYHIKVIFEKDLSSILVHHYLKDRSGKLTTTELADDEYYTGKIGDNYSTIPKMDIEGYGIAKVVNFDGYEKVGNYTLPKNRSGEYIATQVVVTYYYEEIPCEIIVHHYLEGTETSLADDEVVSKYKGDAFETNAKSELLLEEYDLISGATTVNLDGSEYTIDNDTQKVTGNIIKDTEVTYYYKIKEYNITTKVNPTTITRHNEITNEYEEVTVKGGSISGENDKPYEVVQRGSGNQKEIKAIPDDGYRVKKIMIKHGELDPVEIEFTTDVDGTVTLDQFIDVREDKEVIVEFEPIQGKVIVHHYIKGTTIQVLLDDGTRAKDETKTGYANNPYATKRKENLAEKFIYDSVVGETSGKYIDGTIEVTYYYQLLIDIEVTKKWDNTNNIYDKPDSVTIELLADGEKVRETILTKENKVTVEGEPETQETWNYTFVGLPKYDDSGREIVYTVREK